MISDDLRNEIREEIRKIIKEELLLEIVNNKDLEKSLTTYVRSLLYTEVKYLKMVENGFQKIPDRTIFVSDGNLMEFDIPGWVNLHNVTEGKLNEIHNELINSKKTDTDYGLFVSILNGNSEKKINWIQTMSTDKNYINSYGIFDLLYEIDPKIIEFKLNFLKRFLKNVMYKFSEKGDDFSYARLYDSFSKWKNKIKNKRKN